MKRSILVFCLSLLLTSCTPSNWTQLQRDTMRSVFDSDTIEIPFFNFKNSNLSATSYDAVVLTASFSGGKTIGDYTKKLESLDFVSRPNALYVVYSRALSAVDLNASNQSSTNRFTIEIGSKNLDDKTISLAAFIEKTQQNLDISSAEAYLDTDLSEFLPPLNYQNVTMTSSEQSGVPVIVFTFSVSSSFDLNDYFDELLFNDFTDILFEEQRANLNPSKTFIQVTNKISGTNSVQISLRKFSS